MKISLLLSLLLAAIAPALAADYQCRFDSAPAQVVEKEPLVLTASFRVPQGSAPLHCELKNTEEVVLTSAVANVTGEGKQTFTLSVPAQAEAAQIKVALWLGSDWRQPLGAIVHTPLIRVISQEEQARLQQLQAEASALPARLRYKHSARGNIAVLDDALPGFDRALPKTLAAALSRRGFRVSLLDASALSNPFFFSRERFDLLLLTDTRVFPASALESLQRYLAAGGDLIALNGPAFKRLLWQVEGRWTDRDTLQNSLANVPVQQKLLDFEAQDPAAWLRNTNNAASPAAVRFDAPGADGKGHAAHFTIANLTGWDSFAAPRFAPFPAGSSLTCFTARGDARTSQFSVEWREKDGSRWIATVPLTKEWKHYALAPTEFRYWHDSASKNRGGAGDCFHPENAAQLFFGLSFTHNASVGVGKHEFFVDAVGAAALPETLAASLRAMQAANDLPAIEGISPTYKLYSLSSLARVQTHAGQVILPAAKLPKPSSSLAAYARPQGTGFGKDRSWRWVPLLDGINADGKLGGAAGALVINGKAPFTGGLWATFPVTDPRFFRAPAVQAGIVRLAERMLDGVFLYEGGARYYAYLDGENVNLGVDVANFGKQATATQATLTVTPAHGGAPLFSKQFALRVAPGERQKAQAVWAPGRFAATDYTVRVTLTRAGKVIDELQHPLTVWRPSAKPEFITTRDGDFYLNGRKWYPHGVNYMPSSGIGVEDGQYFEYWFDPQPYDPEIVERDLSDIQAIGFNMVSVFIYYRSLDSHNLFDLLQRCRRHGLKVNLSLRPGTPLDFHWDEMRALIEKHHLAQTDTVFAYDLAWEPFFGGYEERAKWDGDWERWVTARYGSIAAAEKAWGFPIPRADGKVTGPSDQQIANDGPWTRLAVDYRRFVDVLIHTKYGEARRLVRGIDPNHLVSFRMTVAGDPTCGQEHMPYDFKGLSGAVDIICPEGYGRIGDWDRVKGGWFTTAYSRCVAPQSPVMWAEFGYSIWDTGRMAVNPDAERFEAGFYRDFYEMVLKSGANGTVCWWFPGGFRTGERSDYGILNPDRTWRPVTRVIHDYATRITAAREIPQPQVWLPVDRSLHSDGIRGIYRETGDAFWKAIDGGKTPGLRWTEPKK